MRVVDDSARIRMARAGVSRGARYALASAEDGRILLTPLASIPASEHLLWEVAKLRESIERGLAQSAAGETVDLGDFTQFLDDEPDDEHLMGGWPDPGSHCTIP